MRPCLGLASKAIPAAERVRRAHRVANETAARLSGSLTAMKRLMRDAARWVAQVDRESATFVERLASAEAMEATTAFEQKRDPNFTKIVRQY
jgi:1,4-dihydroxy-2-naphthoyl-CoA synthase